MSLVNYKINIINNQLSPKHLQVYCSLTLTGNKYSQFAITAQTLQLVI